MFAWIPRHVWTTRKKKSQTSGFEADVVVSDNSELTSRHSTFPVNATPKDPSNRQAHDIQNMKNLTLASRTDRNVTSLGGQDPPLKEQKRQRSTDDATRSRRQNPRIVAHRDTKYDRTRRRKPAFQANW